MALYPQRGAVISGSGLGRVPRWLLASQTGRLIPLARNLRKLASEATQHRSLGTSIRSRGRPSGDFVFPRRWPENG